MLSLILIYVIFMRIAIIFLAFYYLYVKFFRFSNNQNETSEDCITLELFRHLVFNEQIATIMTSQSMIVIKLCSIACLNYQLQSTSVLGKRTHRFV